MSWAASPQVQVAPAGPDGPAGGSPGRRSLLGAAVPRGFRSVYGWIGVAGAGLIWIALLGPVITLATHLSWSAAKSTFSQPGAWDPLIVSVEASLIALGVLVLFCTPLAWALARGTLPFPRVWEIGVLAVLLGSANRVLTRAQLTELLRGRDADPFDRSIDVRISRLRQILGDDARAPQIIKTVYGEGYVIGVSVESQ